MKRNYWPLFFIGIFGFTLVMLIKEIYFVNKVPINEEHVFFRKYQDIDQNFNDIIDSNKKFLSKYDFKALLNNKKFNLTLSDIFLSQRVLEDKLIHRDILKVGDNSIKFIILDKKTKRSVDGLKIKFKASKISSDDFVTRLLKENFTYKNSSYNGKIHIPNIGHWNITVTFKKGDFKGYFFIKTNAI